MATELELLESIDPVDESSAGVWTRSPAAEAAWSQVLDEIDRDQANGSREDRPALWRRPVVVVASAALVVLAAFVLPLLVIRGPSSEAPPLSEAPTSASAPATTVLPSGENALVAASFQAVSFGCGDVCGWTLSFVGTGVELQAFDNRGRQIAASKGTLTDPASNRLTAALNQTAGTELKDWYGPTSFTEVVFFRLSLVLGGTPVDTGYIPTPDVIPAELAALDGFVWDLYEAIASCDGGGLVDLEGECEPASRPSRTLDTVDDGYVMVDRGGFIARVVSVDFGDAWAISPSDVALTPGAVSGTTVGPATLHLADGTTMTVPSGTPGGNACIELVPQEDWDRITGLENATLEQVRLNDLPYDCLLYGVSDDEGNVMWFDTAVYREGNSQAQLLRRPLDVVDGTLVVEGGLGLPIAADVEILCGREMTVDEYAEGIAVFGPRTNVYVEPTTGEVTGLSCTFDF